MGNKALMFSYDHVGSGEITSWNELMINLDLNGLSLDEDDIIHFLSNTTYYTSKFVMEAISKGYVDDYLHDSKVLEHVISLNYAAFFDSSSKENHFVNSMDILLSLDMRNPKIILKFLLNNNVMKNLHDFTFYLKFFKKIINRTEIRASKMDCFKKALEKLNDRYEQDMKNMVIFH